jgi:glycosyltransferase involved in cell wall biosynthesis
LSRREIILFLSRLDRKKGLDLLLPAFARVRKCVPSAALVLAGSGDAVFTTELEAQAQALGVSGDLLWTGFLSGGEKQAALADADVFVLPSYSENFGIAVVEALGAGLPVVISDQVGIYPEIAAAEAGLVVSCDADKVAVALCRLLADQNIRKAMGDRARLLARTTYGVAAVTSKLITSYNRVHLGLQEINQPCTSRSRH